MKQPPKSETKVLFQNTAMLYILQFSSYLLSFLTIPYQTRVLGPTLYGVLGVATAIMAYFQLLMDFGFLLSATEDISLHRREPLYISKKLTSVSIIKLGFGAISFAIVWLLTLLADPFRNYRRLYLLYIAAFIVNGFLPDYLFRGLERMSAITVRTVTVKALSCLLTFALLRQKADYWMVPFLLLVGNLAAVLWAYFYIYRVMKYPFGRVTWREVRQDFKRSSVFFFSRIASTVYSATNTVVMGYVDPVGISTGYFTSADRILSTAKGAVAPISDSLYPYMVKTKNFSTVKKILLWCEPPIVLGAVLLFLLAEPICVLVFGKEFVGAAPVLRAFLPAVVFLLPDYVLGFPTLGAMGLTKYANASIFFGMTVHLLGLMGLAVTNGITAVALAVLTSVSEGSILLFRIVAVWRNQKKGAITV